MGEPIFKVSSKSLIVFFKQPFDPIHFHVFEHKNLLHFAPLVKILCCFADDLAQRCHRNHISSAFTSSILKELSFNPGVFILAKNSPFPEVEFVVFELFEKLLLIAVHNFFVIDPIRKLELFHLVRCIISVKRGYLNVLPDELIP